MSIQPDLFINLETPEAAQSLPATAERIDAAPTSAGADDPNLRPPANDVGEAGDLAQAPPPMNLAAVLALLDDLPLEQRKRAELKSAVNTFCRAVGLAPASITTSVASISNLIAGVAPARTRLSPARWTKVRSLLLTSLRLCGIKVLPGRSTEALSDDWVSLLALIEKSGRRAGLSRFARYMTGKGVEPSEVGKEHFDAFHEDLLTGSLHQKPKATYRTTVRIWNKGSAAIEAWPKFVMDLEPDPRRYSLDWDAFPESFREDLEAFQTRSGDPDPFSDHYSNAVAPATLRLRRIQVQELASALVLSGFPAQDLTSLAVLVTGDNASAALSYLFRRNGKVSKKHLASQANLVVTIARHWVKTRVDDVRLVRIATNLKVSNDGMVPRNRERLLQFDLPDNVEALLNLPGRILRQVERKPSGRRPEALRVMFAVAVEILIMAPMRLKNLAELEIGPHLVQTRRGGASTLHIVVPTANTKTKVPYEMPLPRESQVLLERYIAVYRPRIFAGPSTHLFPGRHGDCRNLGAFSTALSEFVLKETGIVMHPHLFRHLAGKLYLDANPSDIETVRRFLSHRSISTTLRSYTHLTATHAIERYDRLVASLRATLVPTPPSRVRRGSK